MGYELHFAGAQSCCDRAVLLQEYRVVVRIDSWESTSLYPNGHFVRVLGRIGDLEGEIAAILVENSICAAPFSEIQVCLWDHIQSFCSFLVSQREEPFYSSISLLPVGF